MPEIKLPLWGWVQYKSYKCPKPKFAPYKDEDGYYSQVFIEAEIPDEILLQSNFNLWAWHCMNGWQIGDEQLQYKMDLFCTTNEVKVHSFHAYPNELQKRIMKSWESIFNLNYRNRKYHNQPRRNTPIQATFWVLRKEWVKSIRHFTPK